MNKAPTSSDPPSIWILTGVAAVAALSPLINRALDDPVSGQMNAMLFVAGVAFPAVSLIYVLGQPTLSEKLAVALIFLLGGVTLLWVDWGRLDGRVFVVGALFFIPTLVRLVLVLWGRGSGSS